MKLCAIEPKELEEKILIRFAENQNDELLEDLSDYVINSQKEIERLNNVINELEKYLEEERDRIAEGCSHTYEDSLGKTRLVNEDIFNEITKIKDKLQELKGSESNE